MLRDINTKIRRIDKLTEGIKKACLKYRRFSDLLEYVKFIEEDMLAVKEQLLALKAAKIKITDEHIVEYLADIEFQLTEMISKIQPSKTLVELVDTYRDLTIQINEDSKEILEIMQDLEVQAAMRGSERQC